MKRDTLKIHYEFLDNRRLKLLNDLAPLVKNFVLSGGTALSLQIKHRQSFDFDFFSEKEIPSSLLGKLKDLVKISTILANTSDELSFMVSDDIKVSFIYYPFKKKFPLIALKNGLKIFSFKDIAAQKAYTIGRRGTYRDYYDIYALIKGKYSTLKDIIEFAKNIYGEVFNPKLFLEQLVYFGDLMNFEIIPADDSEKIPDPKEVKSFFEKEVKKVLEDWK